MPGLVNPGGRSATAVSWDPSGRLLAGWADSTVVAHGVDTTNVDKT